MAHIITVTIAGGSFWGPTQDTPTQINADKITEIKKPFDNEIGNAVIEMEGGKKLFTTETPEELKGMINTTQ